MSGKHTKKIERLVKLNFTPIKIKNKSENYRLIR